MPFEDMRRKGHVIMVIGNEDDLVVVV